MESIIDVVQVYRRVHEALDGDHLGQAISNLQRDLAIKFFNDTGTKIGPAAHGTSTSQVEQPNGDRTVPQDHGGEVMHEYDLTITRYFNGVRRQSGAITILAHDWEQANDMSWQALHGTRMADPDSEYEIAGLVHTGLGGETGMLGSFTTTEEFTAKHGGEVDDDGAAS